MSSWKTLTNTTLNSSDYLSDTLCHAILDYQGLLKSKETVFKSYLTDKENLQSTLSTKETELFNLETELILLEDTIDMKQSNGEYYMYEYFADALPFIVGVDTDVTKFYSVMLISDIDLNVSINSTQQVQLVANQWSTFKYDNIDNFSIATPIDILNYNVKAVFTSITQDEHTNATVTELNDKYNHFTLIDKVNNKKSEVETVKADIQNVDNSILQLRNEISVENNFTPEQIVERDQFIIEKEWKDDNYIDVNELLEVGKEVLEDMKKPKSVLNMDVVNFLNFTECQRDWNKLALGDKARTKHPVLEINSESQIIEMDVDFESDAINLTIANTRDLNTDDDSILSKLIYDTVSTSSTINMNKHKWDEVAEVKTSVTELIESEWDSTKRQINAGVNNSVTIGRRGITIQDTTDPMKFLRATNGVLALTEDGGNTFKTAILPSGVIAQRLIGEIFIGENLFIQNASGTYTIDKDGFTIQNGALNIVGGLSEGDLDPEYTARINKEIDDLEQATTDLNTDVTNIMSDGKLTHIEANELQRSLDQVKSESADIINLATTYGITTEKVSYSNALADLETYLEDNFLVKQTYPMDITVAQRAEISTKIQTVQTTKSALNKLITETAEQRAKDASVGKGETINGVKIDTEEGLTITRSDNMVRTKMNATSSDSDNISGFKIQKNTGTEDVPNWENVLYADTDGNLHLTGNITMTGGSISWTNVDKPSYSASEVNAKPDTYSAFDDIGENRLTSIDKDGIYTGTLAAKQIVIGSESTFANGYDPTKIEVGGRNLLIGTSEDYTTATMSSWNSSLSDLLTLDSLGLKNGDEITWRFYVNVPLNTDDISARIGFYRADNTYSSVINYSDFVLQGEEGYCSITATIPNDCVSIRFMAHRKNASATSTSFSYTYKKRKVEKGNKATDWTPAIEDVNKEISDLNNAVGDLSTEIDNFSSDGKITLAEANMLETQLNQVNKESEDIISVSTNLSITTEKTNYNNALTALTTEINKWINQSSYPLDITTTDRTNINTKFQTVQDTKSKLINKITDVQSTNAENNAIDYTNKNTGNLVNNPTATGEATGWSDVVLVNHTFQNVSVPVIQSSVLNDTQHSSDWFAVDPSKAYEVSMWIKKSHNEGRSYIGLNAIDSNGNTVGLEDVTNDGVIYNNNNINFYFWYSYLNQAPTNWVKIVGYIMPSGTTDSDMENIGAYPDGAIKRNARMKPNTRKIRVRFLNGYTNTLTRETWIANAKIVEVDPNSVIYGAKANSIITDNKSTWDKASTALQSATEYNGVKIDNQGLLVTSANNTLKMNASDGIVLAKGADPLFYLDTNGDLNLKGNITMTGGSISWADVGKPSYSASEVNALADNWVGTTYIDQDGLYTGTIVFDQAKGGILALGGANNDNGRFVVYNADSEVIADLDANRGGFSDLNVSRLYVGEHFDAPNVVKSSNESYIIYVRGSLGSDDNSGLGSFDNGLYSLKEAFKRIPQIVNGTIEIWFSNYYDITEGLCQLNGISGGGEVIINLRGNTFKGRMKFNSNNVRVNVHNGKFDTSGGTIYLIDNESSQYLSLKDLILNGNGQERAVRIWRNGYVWAENLEIYNTVDGFSLSSGGRAYLYNNKGLVSGVAIKAESGASVHRAGTGVYGQTAHVDFTASVMEVGSVTVNSGTATVPPPVVTEQTQVWTATSSGSWRGSWRTDSNYVYQGEWNGWGLHKGCWFFGTGMRDTLLGKTIKRVKITIQRRGEGGYSSSVNAIVRMHSHSSKPTSEPNTSSTNTSVGFKWGEKKEFTLPDTFHSLFSNGSWYGLALYTTSTNNSNYMIFNTTCEVEVTYE